MAACSGLSAGSRRSRTASAASSWRRCASWERPRGPRWTTAVSVASGKPKVRVARACAVAALPPLAARSSSGAAGALPRPGSVTVAATAAAIHASGMMWRSPTTTAAYARAVSPCRGRDDDMSFPWLGPARADGHGNVELGREVLEDPVRAQHRTAVRAPREAHVVARARVHRELALDRIPVVVLLDEHVEVVAAPRARERVPAPREGARVRAARPPTRPVGARQALLLGRDAVVD